ncbi:LPXTG cell wall anchor domain-containing protein [Staphylococcus epidermidis]|nr:LPXTG cell wall anchor domain-containing protein [Staphylococcus epidermidis]
MKTTKILGVTTLAGALLFTGLGQVNASEKINTNNAVSIADKIAKNDEAKKNSFSPGVGSDIGNNPYTATKKGNDYIISYPNKRSYTYKLTSEGKLYALEYGKQYYIAHEDINNSQKSAQDKQIQKNNNVKHNNQNQDEALPETGEESSNTTLITMIASIILAAGSLLTFRRTSK